MRPRQPRARASRTRRSAWRRPSRSLPASPQRKETPSMKLPPKLGPIHFIGLGGIGMSGIAEVMANLGYTVQGSDASDNYNVKRLAEKGIKTYGTNARMGEGDWMVVEADESDGTFLKLPADVAIVTNIDPEHLDHFQTFDAIKDAFRAFIDNIPFYGFAVMCTDHPIVQDLVGKIEDRRVITYGENPQADICLTDIDLTGGRSRFRVLIRDRKSGATTEIADLGLPMPGAHNA